MTGDSSTTRQPVAVVGISTLFPGRGTVEGFWQDIIEGADLIRDVPETHWPVSEYFDPDPLSPGDKAYCKRGSFISAVPFDPIEFGIPPTVMAVTDSSQLLALILTKQVLEDAASHRWHKLDRSRISVILGAAGQTELQGLMAGRGARPVCEYVLKERGVPQPEVEEICDRISSAFPSWHEGTLPGMLNNVIAGRITNRFDFGGTNMTLDAACASSLMAVSAAVNELRLGLSDLVLTGGVDLNNGPGAFISFCKTPALSPTGDCRPFSEHADGTILGEGLGFFALRRLEDAERDGDPIYAVIRGIGTSSDGKATSIYAPRREGQITCMRRAYEQAGYLPATVGLVEAHGTGTTVGDSVEMSSLREIFEEDEDGAAGRNGPVAKRHALGSIKSQIGHAKGAAGAAGLFKVAMALHHKILPPTLKVERPNPELALDKGPFYLNTAARPWIADPSHPRRACVSAFGFGGTNVHVTLEEYRGSGNKPPRCRPSPAELILISSESFEGLERDAGAICDQARRGTPLAAIARDRQERFGFGARTRLAVVAGSAEDLVAKLSRAIAVIAKDPAHSFSEPAGVRYRVGNKPIGKLAFVFPGQSSQYVGMGADIAMAFDAAREVWENDKARSENSGPLHDIVFPAPVFTDAERSAQASRLAAVDAAQPALAAMSLSLLGLLQKMGIAADMVAGHSFGEVMALHAAGAYDADLALSIAGRRGELMVAAGANVPGAMTAVAIDRSKIEALLESWGLPLVIANHNAPRQVVLSGPLADVETAEAHLRKQGVATQRLPVATAFHSPIVSASAVPLRQFLDGVPMAVPALPVFSNVTAQPYGGDIVGIKSTLANQIAASVRFAEMIDAMYAADARIFVEVGPGGVLTGLIGQCLGDRPFAAIALDRKGQHGLTSLWDALGHLAVLGVAIDFSVLWTDIRLPEDRSKPLKSHVVWVDSRQLGKPLTSETALAKLAEGKKPGAISPTSPVPGAWATPPDRATPNRLQPPVIEPAKRPDTRREATEVEAILREAAATQELYLRTMEESHRAYLEIVNRALGGSAISTDSREQIPAGAASSPSSATAPDFGSSVGWSEAVETFPPPSVQQSPQIDLDAGPSDLKDILIEIVAEKTGYPRDLLDLDMELEAGLGVDSIKRVQIFVALQERFPNLPTPGDADLLELTSLKTLGQIIAYIEDQTRRLNVAPAAETRALASSPDMPVSELRGILLATVAEKMGYPEDSLKLNVDLEEELGIDSSMREEIIAAFQHRVSGSTPLDEPNARALSGLKTLGEIVEFMTARQTGDAVESDPLSIEPVVMGRVNGVHGTGVSRHIVTLQPAPASGISMLERWRSGVVAVVPDDGGVAEALVGLLHEAGHEAIVTRKVPAHAAGVIFLGGLGREAGPEYALGIHRAAFLAAKAVADRLTEQGGFFVTVQDTGGDFGLTGNPGARAWLGGLTGLVKTAGKCWPKADVKAIDLDRDGHAVERLAEIILRELEAGGPEIEVGISRARVTPVTQITGLLRGGTLAVDGRSVLLVTGGARGITAECLVELAQTCRPTFVLLGRTELMEEPDFTRGVAADDLKRVILAEVKRSGQKINLVKAQAQATRTLAIREIRGTLARLEAAGSRAVYVSVDVRDRDALATSVQGIRSSVGPITGLIHGAGVLADKLIRDKTVGQFEQVFQTKVAGLANLLDVTSEDKLRLLCLFSSIAARTGNVGQCDYAMANEVLNKVAQSEARRRGPDCLVRSINWGPWEGGMVTPTLTRLFKAARISLISPSDGANFFVEELRVDPDGPVEIVASGGPELLARMAEQRERKLELAIGLQA